MSSLTLKDWVPNDTEACAVMTSWSRAVLLALCLSLESVLLSLIGDMSPFCLFFTSVVNWPKPIWQHRVFKFFYSCWMYIHYQR